MIPELLGVKTSTAIPALAGALVYSMRVGEQSWVARLTGGLAGFLTAAYVAPAVVEHFAFGEAMGGGITFAIGVMGAVLIETAWGIMRDPAGFYARIKAGRKFK